MINKITKIQPINPIPPEQLKWCGVPASKKKPEEKKHDLSFGDLVLYDKFGKKQVYTMEPESEK